VLLALAGAFPVAAQERADPAGELQVEAAFLVNFVRYSDWPRQRFASPASPYVVTVVGPESVAATVAAVASAAGDIQGRRIEVRRVDASRVDAARADVPRGGGTARQADAAARLRGSHMVFIHHSAGVAPDQVLRLLSGVPVLTVSDVPGFALDGGMLGLVRNGRRLVFEANPPAIQAAGIVVSAKVLKLARIAGRTQ
jgi:hypothetical protein